MTEAAYNGRQVVGIDLHRRRSVIVRMTEDGRKLETVRIASSPAALRAVIARAGKNPRVVIEGDVRLVYPPCDRAGPGILCAWHAVMNTG